MYIMTHHYQRLFLHVGLYSFSISVDQVKVIQGHSNTTPDSYYKWYHDELTQ